MATMENLIGLVNSIQRACTVLGDVKACLSGKLSRPLLLLVARVLENLQSRKTLLAEISFLVDLRNSFQGQLPASLMKPRYFETLDLGENAFTGPIPSWIGEKFSVEILNIHSNEFDGEIPLEPRHLTQLRVLNLARNRISVPVIFLP